MAGRSLLLIDDDEASTQILGIILEDEGYAIDSASTGAAALAKVSQKKYDLALLDYVLPDIRGHELAVKLTAIDSSLKIILLTGYSKMNENLPETGARYAKILLKPVSPDDIVQSVKEALG